MNDFNAQYRNKNGLKVGDKVRVKNTYAPSKGVGAHPGGVELRQVED